MTPEERLRILQMLEEGKITAEEAAALLRSIGGRRESPADTTYRGEGRFLRVRVTDITTGRTKVNITVPLQLVKWGLQFAERFAPDAEVDWKELAEAITSGVGGKMVDIEDLEDNERVEVYVE
jgi:DUF4097 and DUF4098 domain-containing protein YvlB